MSETLVITPDLTRAQLLARITGATVLAAGAMLYGNGTSSVQTLAAGTAGQVMVSAGAAAPVWTNIYGQANVWTAAQAFRANGSHFFGVVAATGLTNVAADGGNSGTNGGASFFVRGNGATTAAWGNFSSILGGAYDARTTLYSAASDIVFQHGGTTAATLTTSGNLGIGVTPNLWSNTVALQFTGGSLNSFGSGPSLNQNCYYDGTDWRYISTGFAARYAQVNASGHVWYNAPNAAAGTVATFAVAMQLDPNGNLGLGVTPTAGNGLLQIASGTSKANGFAMGADIFGHRAGSNHFRFDLGGTPILEIYTSSNTVPVLRFTQNGTSNRCSIGANGTIMEFRHNGGTLNMSMSETTWGVFGNRISKPTVAAAATDAATTQTLANSIRTILINYGLAS